MGVFKPSARGFPFISLVILTPFLLACSLLASLWDLLPGEVLLRDDFSDARSGWSQVEGDQGSTSYVGGFYRIQVSQPGVQVWGSPGKYFNNVRIQVEATKMAGVDDNLFGVLCRYRNQEQFYAFLLSSDGYYGIAKYVDHQFVMLGATALKPSEAIHRGNMPNWLEANCLGTRLELFVNQVELISVEDATYPSGDVGLLAGSQEVGGVEVYFDNIQVLKP